MDSKNLKRLVQSLKDAGIRDEAVLQAMSEVPREWFVDEALRMRAYDDIPLPIGYGQTISQPYVVARMTELIHTHELNNVLEIGTGSGYQAAILSKLAKNVYSIERIQALYERAKKALLQAKIFNVHMRYDDGGTGWRVHAPYDAIIITAGHPMVHQTLLTQLKDGARLIAPIGQGGEQVLQLYTRYGDNFQTVSLDPVRFVPLKEGTE